MTETRTPGETSMPPVHADWQTVTGANDAAAEVEAMERFWLHHIREPDAALTVTLRDPATGTPIPVNDFKADTPAAQEVVLTVNGETLTFRPQSAESFYMLLRE